MNANVKFFAAVEETDDGEWIGIINCEVNGEVIETYQSNKRFNTESECRTFTEQALRAVHDACNDDAEDLTVH